MKYAKQISFMVFSLLFSVAALAEPYGFLGIAASGDSGAYLVPGAGYRVNRHVAFEAAYMDPGTFATETSVSSAKKTVTETTRWLSASAMRLSVVWTIPVSKALSVLASGSIYSVRGSAGVNSINWGVKPAVFATTSKTSGSDVVPGAGLALSWSLPENFFARASVETFVTTREMFGGSADAGSLTTYALSFGRYF